MTLVNESGHFIQKPQFNSIPLKSDQSGIIPRFYSEDKETDQVDPSTGFKVFRKVEFVELLIPGDKGSAPVKRVNDEIKRIYASAYAAFKERGAGADMIDGGIPLNLWPGIKSEIARGLETIHIYTVQQLAGLADGKCSQPGTIGLRDLRDKARAFLETASKTAPVAALQAQIDEMQKHSALRDAQLEQMIARNSELQAQVSAQGGAASADQMPELSTPRGKNKDR